MDNRALSGLSECETNLQIIELFEIFKIDNVKERREYIKEALGSPEMHYSPNECTDEELLEYEIDIFLNGKWKNIKAYPAYKDAK